MRDSEKKTPQLGRVIAATQLKYPPARELWIGVPASLLISGVSFFAARLFVNDPYPDPRVIILAPLVGIALLLWSLWVLYLALATFILQTRITVYQGGISKQTRWNQEAWTWDKINSYRMRHVTTMNLDTILSTEKLNLRINAGNRQIIHLNQRFKDTAELVPLITSAILKRHFPRYQSAYEQGKMLDFGLVRMNLQQVQIGRKSIPRSDISRWETDNNTLILHRHNNKPIRLDLSQIPNRSILIELGRQSVVTADEITRKFGNLSHKYTYNRTRVLIVIGLALLWSFIPTVILAVLIWRRDFDAGKMAFVAIPYIAPAFVVWKVWSMQQRAAEIYERGIRIIDHKGEKSWYWKDFTELVIEPEDKKEKDPSLMIPVYHLYIVGEDVLSINRVVYRDGLALMADVVDHISDQLLPQYIDAFQAGETLSFSEFHVNQHECSLRGQTIQWKDFAGYKQEKSMLHLYNRNQSPPISVPIFGTDNIHILINLLDEQTRRQERNPL